MRVPQSVTDEQEGGGTLLVVAQVVQGAVFMLQEYINKPFFKYSPIRMHANKKIDTMKKVEAAVQTGDHICIGIVSGVVNHIAPAG